MDEITKQPHNRLQGANRAAAESIGQIGDRASQAIRSGTESAQRVVADYPVSAMLASFALGAATGVFLGALLIEAPRPRWHERVPDALGRRWIESLIEALPESVRSKVR